MEKTLKIGIIGCGGIANGKHMPSLSRLKNCELVAFCDIVLEKAQKAFQDEVDAIVLRPVRMREITREQAVKLAHAISDDESFSIIMEIAKVPGYALAEREDMSSEKEAE